MWFKLGLALVSGLLLPLAFAPIDLWFCALLAPALLLLACDKVTARQAMLLGWVFGLGLYGLGVSWIYVSIHDYGYASIPLAVILTALLVMGLALLMALQTWALVKFFPYTYWIVAFPALWVLFEWLRAWLLTGFPWLYVGTAFIDTWLAGYIPIVGVLGVSFIVVAMSAALICPHPNPPPQAGEGIGRNSSPLVGRVRVGAAFIILIIWILGALLQKIEWTKTKDDKPFRVSLVQGNIPQSIKWDPDYVQQSLHTYQSLTTPHWQQDLILWPETAIPMLYDEAKNFITYLDRQAKKTQAALITGIPYQMHYSQPPYARYHNSILVVGEGSGLYHKQRLVPFGEYVPLDYWLRGMIQFFDLPMSSFSVGAAEQANLMVKGHQVAPFICYEIAYSSLVNRMAQQAELLITISNDTWFGASIGPHQHLQIARTRALETGRYLLRATNNGISAIIDAKGKILSQTQQFKQEVLNGKAELKTGLTPYMRWGDYLIVGLSGLLLFLIRLRIMKQRSVF